MPVQRKVFRIEQIGVAARLVTLDAAEPTPELPHDEILGELKALRTLLDAMRRQRPHTPSGWWHDQRLRPVQERSPRGP